MSSFMSKVRSRGLIARALSVAMLVSLAGCTESAASIPDLTGQWGRDMVFLEPPPSGPGPILNTVRKADGTMDFNALVGDYTSPILKPEAAEVVRRRGEISLSGTPFPDPHNQCWPEPPPFILGVQFGVQILQQSDKVTLIYLADHKVRHVPLNVPHPVNVTPTWQGDSVGRYEGDTLVIDTVGIKVGPLSMVDLYGTPHSEALHVIERYRLLDGEASSQAHARHLRTYFDPDGDTSNLAFEDISPFYGRGDIDPDATKKGLQIEIAMEDPGVFTMPWSGLVTYRPVNKPWPVEWPEAVCAENTRRYHEAKDIEAPQADKPDF
jgi:hypothetical protein